MSAARPLDPAPPPDVSTVGEVAVVVPPPEPGSRRGGRSRSDRVAELSLDPRLEPFLVALVDLLVADLTRRPPPT